MMLNGGGRKFWSLPTGCTGLEQMEGKKLAHQDSSGVWPLKQVLTLLCDNIYVFHNFCPCDFYAIKICLH